MEMKEGNEGKGEIQEEKGFRMKIETEEGSKLEEWKGGLKTGKFFKKSCC